MADQSPLPRRPVRTLAADVARKIAAGEVIDRPCAIVRELMDNAIDSGATRISVEIAGGGIARVRVADNGSGMTREDLAACARPHATSKITNADDLLRLSTLGFRGEALASIAACARLSIASGSWRMCASLAEPHRIEAVPPVQDGQGTIVQSEGLFEDFPARRVFLKRTASETMLCRETFIEKTLARTDIAFRLTVDGALRNDLPAGVSLAERFTRALGLKEAPSLFYELKARDADWSFRLVIGEPGIRRSDRKQLFIYVNGRRVSEFSLLQAVEYGAQGFFPNGTHPVCALFVEMNPALVDFNIHPAKREVRFKNSAELHHSISSTVRDFFRSYGIQGARNADERPAQAEMLAGFEDGAQNTDAHAPYAALMRAGHTDTAQGNARRIAHETQTADTLVRTTVRDAPPNGESAAALAALALAEDGTTQASYEITERSAAVTAPDAADASNAERRVTFAADDDVSLQTTAPTSTSLRARLFDYDRAPATDARYDITHRRRRVVSDSASYTKRAQTTTEGAFIADIIEYARTPCRVDESGTFRFLGAALGTFLIAEVDSTLYFIDQHAAHERILFDRLTHGKIETQELLIPYTVTAESDDDERYMEQLQPTLHTIGFTCTRTDSGAWKFTTVPARWTGTESDLAEALLTKHVAPEKLLYNIAAMTACKAAVKDGYVLDAATAANLARSALALPDPHCPHGRPVWTTLTREQLFARVRRTE